MVPRGLEPSARKSGLLMVMKHAVVVMALILTGSACTSSSSVDRPASSVAIADGPSPSATPVPATTQPPEVPGRGLRARWRRPQARPPQELAPRLPGPDRRSPTGDGELLGLRGRRSRGARWCCTSGWRSDVLWVFRQLFRARFPIHRIDLAPRPQPIDWNSTRNLTSSFNCRAATGNPGVAVPALLRLGRRHQSTAEPVRAVGRLRAARGREAVPGPLPRPPGHDPSRRCRRPVLRAYRMGMGRQLAHAQGLHALLVTGR